ncbi:MAG: hypothetical protein GTO45_36910 [Candidatus Aminicenantes bacterium]|nr:hypothetical protein [Candidatus Aminicenantes bacterium]NIM78228.1 hypothetical protein [Candidatus Aminicenantes bacterium]NIN23734.1 hypothetical protein [Candidatus Aminicenantes bacterium]NIN47441.1 hypothetical protein [Candidatus Aminicenantes bacterium]NIN90369.1 hypothetical protein [Candidatus Aminicenantes bacterium]
MKRVMLMVVLSFMVAISTLVAQEVKVDIEKEKAAIKQAALDYMEGWYEGNAQRMKKALHPEMVKRVPTTLPTGRVTLRYASASNMVEFTRAGFGKNRAQHKGKLEVKIFDISRNIASAKATSGEYIDYLHLVKIHGQWKILNVLWEPAKPPAKKK